MGRLPQDIDETSVKDLLSEQGLVAESIAIKTGGCAFVDFKDNTDADAAIKKLNGTLMYAVWIFVFMHIILYRPWSSVLNWPVDISIIFTDAVGR